MVSLYFIDQFKNHCYKIILIPTIQLPKMSSISEIPLLSEKHSGIPQNLLGKAQKAKSLIYETRTKETNTRQRLPVIPQGVEKEAFTRALDELGEQFGKENVEVNDKPLVDGWYMERKSWEFSSLIILNYSRSKHPRYDANSRR